MNADQRNPAEEGVYNGKMKEGRVLTEIFKG